jgi:hypothetical protein
LNRRPRPYQGRALPTELPGRENADRTPSRRVLAHRSSAVQEVRLRRSSLRSRRSRARSTFSRGPPPRRSLQHARAGDGNRTRDVQLGRLMLYQLSYSRVRRNADRGASRRVLAHHSSAYRRTYASVVLHCARDDLPHAPRSANTEPLRSGAQSRRPESNRRPADYKSAALPSELRRPAGSSPPANVVVCYSTPLSAPTPVLWKTIESTPLLVLRGRGGRVLASDQLVPRNGVWRRFPGSWIRKEKRSSETTVPSL